jgi:hypothetical protein
MIVRQGMIKSFTFEANDGEHLGEVQVGDDKSIQIFIDLDYLNFGQFKETVSSLNGVLDRIRGEYEGV